MTGNRTRKKHRARKRQSRSGWLSLLLLVLFLAGPGFAQESGLPSPLRQEDVIRYALEHRQEIVAARARTLAAEQRPKIVSTLEDPMVMPSVDHLPFMLQGVDASVMVEQKFPLSGILQQRRRASELDARRIRAMATTTGQDVALSALGAFLMLRERRETLRIVLEQIALARSLVGAAAARYGAGTGGQPEVLRAEVEVARLEGFSRALVEEVSGAEAMLNASLGRAVDTPVPPTVPVLPELEPEAWAKVHETTLRGLPELKVGRAEVDRAGAEIPVMKSMYLPMALVRTGPAYTMTDGWGWMLTVGISVPIWQGKYAAGVREAEAMQDMARSDLAAMTRMAEGEAATARNLVLAARQRLFALRDDVLPRARQTIEPSLASYAAGVLPLVAVIDAAQALWSLELDLVLAEYDLGLAWARLQRAQGLLNAGGQP